MRCGFTFHGYGSRLKHRPNGLPPLAVAVTMGLSFNPKRGDSMDKFNPMQYVDVNTLPMALQRGLDMVLRPADTWAQVRAEEGSATVPGLLLGYALWWVLWAVLGGLVVIVLWGMGVLGLIPGASALLGQSAQFGVGGMAFVLVAAAWGAVQQLFSWYAVIFIMGLGLHLLIKQKDGTVQPPVRLLLLVVYAMTPVWLLAPLMTIPVLGTWAMYVGMGYGLYLMHQGMTALTDKPPEQSVIDMVMLAVLAMFVALMFSGLGWLALIGGGVWLFIRAQAKADDAAVQAAQPKATTATDAQPGAQTKTSEAAPAFNAMGEHSASAMHDMPVHELPERPVTPFPPPVSTPASTAASTHAANASKIAALDKKIVKATAQGDMAEVSRLMGERGLLLQTPNHDF
jgi:hypothetical protein